MVEHLTFEELLEFNSLTKEEAANGTLAAHVNTHLRGCAECRKSLFAIQALDQKMTFVCKTKGMTTVDVEREL